MSGLKGQIQAQDEIFRAKIAEVEEKLDKIEKAQLSQNEFKIKSKIYHEIIIWITIIIITLIFTIN